MLQTGWLLYESAYQAWKGFKEIIYKDALEIEFKQDDSIIYEREKSFAIVYENIVLPHTFNADFLAFKSIVLEIKAVSQINSESFRQTLNYLKASQVNLEFLLILAQTD